MGYQPMVRSIHVWSIYTDRNAEQSFLQLLAARLRTHWHATAFARVSMKFDVKVTKGGYSVATAELDSDDTQVIVSALAECWSRTLDEAHAANDTDSVACSIFLDSGHAAFGFGVDPLKTKGGNRILLSVVSASIWSLPDFDDQSFDDSMTTLEKKAIDFCENAFDCVRSLRGSRAPQCAVVDIAGDPETRITLPLRS